MKNHNIWSKIAIHLPKMWITICYICAIYFMLIYLFLFYSHSPFWGICLSVDNKTFWQKHISVDFIHSHIVLFYNAVFIPFNVWTFLFYMKPVYYATVREKNECSVTTFCIFLQKYANSGRGRAVIRDYLYRISGFLLCKK